MYNQKYWISRLEMVISQIFRCFLYWIYCCHHFCLSHILLFALGPTDISNVSFDILHAAANARDSQCFVLHCGAWFELFTGFKAGQEILVEGGEGGDLPTSLTSKKAIQLFQQNKHFFANWANIHHIKQLQQLKPIQVNREFVANQAFLSNLATPAIFFPFVYDMCTLQGLYYNHGKIFCWDLLITKLTFYLNLELIFGKVVIPVANTQREMCRVIFAQPPAAFSRKFCGLCMKYKIFFI